MKDTYIERDIKYFQLINCNVDCLQASTATQSAHFLQGTISKLSMLPNTKEILKHLWIINAISSLGCPHDILLVNFEQEIEFFPSDHFRHCFCLSYIIKYNNQYHLL